MKNKHFPFLLAVFLMFHLFLPVIPVSAEEIEKPVIILDPGHGGIDGGTNTGIRTEKVYNLIIAQYLREELMNHGGFEVILTREDNDLYQKFFPRAINIVKYNADLILSIHCNSSTYTYVNGMEAITSLIPKYSADKLGNLILNKVCAATGMRNRGIFTREDTGDSLGVYYWDSDKNWDMPGATHLGQISDYFSINTWACKFGVRSLILEHGYLSNSVDREIMDKDENLRKIAKAEAEALIEYYYGHTHTFTANKVVDFPSNCTMTGTQSYHCTICGIKAGTEPLPAAPDAHFYRQSASMNPTCSKEGFIEYTCQISYNLNAGGYGNTVHTHKEIIPAETHNYVKTGQVPPTCTSTGETVYTCSVCSHVYSETIPAAGHQALGSDVCKVCGANLTEETAPRETQTPETSSPSVPPCTHIFEVKSQIEPSCEETGMVTSVCSLCGAETTEVKQPLGHSYITDNSEGRCSLCGKSGELSSTSPRNLSNLFKNPLFFAAVVFVLIQAILITVIIIINRHRTHKSRRHAHTYNKKR